jgi:uncharacterized Zn-finger protein
VKNRILVATARRSSPVQPLSESTGAIPHWWKTGYLYLLLLSAVHTISQWRNKQTGPYWWKSEQYVATARRCWINQPVEKTKNAFTLMINRMLAFCSILFAQSGALKRHELVRTDSKPYDCRSNCWWFINVSTSLVQHRVHTVQRPYTILTSMFLRERNDISL